MTLLFNAILFVWLAFATFGATLKLRERSPASYLTRRPADVHETQAYNFINTSLNALRVSEPDEIRNHLLKLERFKSDGVQRDTIGDNLTSKKLNDLLFELLQLADTKAKCRYNTIAYYINLVDYVFGSMQVLSKSEPPMNERNLFNYLKHYGQSKFESCSSNLIDYYQKSKTAKKFERRDDFEEAFDALIASQGKQKGQADKQFDINKQQHLSQLASNLDLVSGHFNAKKMAKVAKQFNEDESMKVALLSIEEEWSQSQEPYFILTTFLAVKCAPLLESLSKLFNVYNINRLLNPTSNRVQISDRLHKLNEYGRLCNQFQSSDTKEEVLANMRRQLLSGNKFIEAAKSLVRCS